MGNVMNDNDELPVAVKVAIGNATEADILEHMQPLLQVPTEVDEDNHEDQLTTLTQIYYSEFKALADSYVGTKNNKGKTHTHASASTQAYKEMSDTYKRGCKDKEEFLLRQEALNQANKEYALKIKGNKAGQSGRASFSNKVKQSQSKQNARDRLLCKLDSSTNR